MASSRTSAAAIAAVCALLLAGCFGGGEKEQPSRVRGDVLTVYSSLPQRGLSRDVARAVAAGERHALADAGGRVGRHRVELVELGAIEEDDELVWDPDQVSANAERAAEDPTTIAYLGELDYGGTAVSLPITNDAGILQVSPTDGLTSLTQEPPGRPRAGPDRYYPTGERTFLRLVPNDLLLVETLLEQLREDGAERLAVLYDPQIYGRELAAQLVARARRDGPEPVLSEELPDEVDQLPDLVRDVADADPDVVVVAGVAGLLTAPLLAALDRRLPGVPVAGAAGLLARDPRRPIPAAPDSVEALTPVEPASEATARGRRILREIELTDGPEVARPEALYGYEAMRVVLDAIAAGGADRAAVARAALATRPRASVLGPYDVRGTGDVGGEDFARYRLRDGRFAFDSMVR